MAKGWHREPGRHALAAKGVPTGNLASIGKGSCIANRNIDVLPFYVGITPYELDSEAHMLGFGGVYSDIRDNIRNEEKRRGERVTEDKIDARITGYLQNGKPDMSRLSLLHYRPSFVLFWQMIDEMEKRKKTRGE